MLETRSGFVMLGAAVALVAVGFLSLGATGQGGPLRMGQEENQANPPALNELTLTILHDNYPYADRLKTAWGFSALVTGPEKTILFDSGSDGALLLENMDKLQVDPNEIDVVILSHIHGDHTGGLLGFLKRRSGVEVWLLHSFPARFKDAVRAHGATVVDVNEPQAICANVYTTGLVGKRIEEQALIVRTQRGLVVLTGCAHPGVVRMLDRARDSLDEKFLFVMGGFHLGWATKGEIEEIIAAFQERGVQYVAPTHCSGDKARELFAQSFGPRYVRVGAGRVVILADLK